MCASSQVTCSSNIKSLFLYMTVPSLGAAEHVRVREGGGGGEGGRWSTPDMLFTEQRF